MIKYIVKDKLSDQSMDVALALREMQNLFGFSHPNVVKVYSAGTLIDEVGEEKPFVLMEHIEGATPDESGCHLEEWRAQQEVSLHEAAEICSVIASTMRALHEFHKKTILHLDLKPANIMVRGGRNAPADASTIKVIDFGSLVGTKKYSAPERGVPKATPSVGWDIFSLGCLIYFMVTGQHPETALRKSQTQWEDWLQELDLGNSDLALICRKCLAYDPNQRYSSAGQVEEDLQAWLTDHPLKHAGRVYRWWETERLLFKRSWDRNDLADHVQIVARASLAVAFAVIAMGIAFLCRVAIGIPAVDAMMGAGDVTNFFAMALLFGFLLLNRFQLNSAKIFEPVLALVALFFYMLHLILPSQPFATISLREMNQAGVLAILVIGILNIAFGATHSEWRSARWVGWSIMVLAALTIPLIGTQVGSIAIPLALVVTEAGCCLNLALCIPRRQTTT